jgi:hypothetical protein
VLNTFSSISNPSFVSYVHRNEVQQFALSASNLVSQNNLGLVDLQINQRSMLLRAINVAIPHRTAAAASPSSRYL